MESSKTPDEPWERSQPPPNPVPFVDPEGDDDIVERIYAVLGFSSPLRKQPERPERPERPELPELPELPDTHPSADRSSTYPSEVLAASDTVDDDPVEPPDDSQRGDPPAPAVDWRSIDAELRRQYPVDVHVPLEVAADDEQANAEHLNDLIRREHQAEMRLIHEDIERHLPGANDDPELLIGAVTQATRSGNLVGYDPSLLAYVLVELAKQLIANLLLPGALGVVLPPPDSLISALFTAAQLRPLSS